MRTLPFGCSFLLMFIYVNWFLVVCVLVNEAGPLTVVPVAAAKKAEAGSPVDDSRLQDRSNISGSPYRAGNCTINHVWGDTGSGTHLIDLMPGIVKKGKKLTRLR